MEKTSPRYLLNPRPFLESTIPTGINSTAKAASIALAICLAYGFSDEIHQLFVPGRAFEISDLAMDGLGSLIGIGLASLKRS